MFTPLKQVHLFPSQNQIFPIGPVPHWVAILHTPHPHSTPRPLANELVPVSLPPSESQGQRPAPLRVEGVESGFESLCDCFPPYWGAWPASDHSMGLQHPSGRRNQFISK